MFTITHLILKEEQFFLMFVFKAIKQTYPNSNLETGIPTCRLQHISIIDLWTSEFHLWKDFVVWHILLFLLFFFSPHFLWIILYPI